MSSASGDQRETSPESGKKKEEPKKPTTNNGGVPYSKSNALEQEKLLLEPFAYLLQVPGKNIRKKLLHAFNFWMKIPQETALKIGEIIQMLHNAR